MDRDGKQTIWYNRRMQAHLVVESISKRFASSAAPVVDCLSLDFAPGSKTLLIGNNGSGKTTLLKLMTGLFEADRGKILLDGQPLGRINAKDLGVFLGLDFLHAHLTTRENLRFSASLFAAARPALLVEHATEVWELTSFLEKEVGSLSQGQKARVALARSTLHGPRLLLLDEPWNFLDPHGTEILENYLNRFAGTLVATSASPIPESKAFTHRIQL